jgi:hypothetical protein
MDVVITSETSVRFYHTTQHNMPEDTNIHKHRYENLKFH